MQQASSSTPSHKAGLTVLLTGASGFIGTQILCQLLANSQIVKVIVLVRGETHDAALHRTVNAAKEAQWWIDQHLQRVIVWKGDLSKPQLGLEDGN